MCAHLHRLKMTSALGMQEAFLATRTCANFGRLLLFESKQEKPLLPRKNGFVTEFKILCELDDLCSQGRILNCTKLTPLKFSSGYVMQLSTWSPVREGREWGLTTLLLSCCCIRFCHHPPRNYLLNLMIFCPADLHRSYDY